MEQEQLELKCLQYLVQDDGARQKLKRRQTGLRLAYFTGSASSHVAEWVIRYATQYKEAPPSHEVLSSFSAPYLQLIEDPLKSWCQQLILQLYQPVKFTETFEFCVDQLAIGWKKQTAIQSLNEAVEELRQNRFDEFAERLGLIVRRVSSAEAVSRVSPVADYPQLVADHRYRAAHRELYTKIPTGIHYIDKCFGGGLALGEYYLLMAYTGRGKSFMGTQVAYHAAWSGHNVVLANLEMSNKKAANRMNSRITGIPYIRFAEPWMMTPENYDLWQQRIEEWGAEGRGKIDFVSFDRVPSVEDIIARLEELPHEIELLVIDQITNMSTRLEWQELELIAKKLEWLAKTWRRERGLAILTFGQVKSETKEYTELTEQHFAYGKPVCEHATGVLYLTQPPENRRNDTLLIGACKNRDGATPEKPDILFPDFERARIHCRERLEREISDGNLPF